MTALLPATEDFHDYKSGCAYTVLTQGGGCLVSVLPPVSSGNIRTVGNSSVAEQTGIYR